MKIKLSTIRQDVKDYGNYLVCEYSADPLVVTEEAIGPVQDQGQLPNLADILPNSILSLIEIKYPGVVEFKRKGRDSVYKIHFHVTRWIRKADWPGITKEELLKKLISGVAIVDLHQKAKTVLDQIIESWSEYMKGFERTSKKWEFILSEETEHIKSLLNNENPENIQSSTDI